MAEWAALGDRAIRFARPAQTSPRALVRAIRSWPGVVDVVVAREDVAAYFDRAPTVDPAWVRALADLPDDPAPVREIALRARYDGPDLAAIAEATGVPAGEIGPLHAAATYVVETMGFAPGFAYMTGLDRRLELPRRATPRPRVPAGSIAIAGPYTGVYPFDSPGGWHVIGTVLDAPMFGSAGALLRLGDRVRFVSGSGS
jgi:KipI family sensor histidine kinase inhibitor